MWVTLGTHRHVGELEEHGIDDVESCELVQGRWGQDDLASPLQVVPLGAGHHGDRVAAVLSLEGTGQVGEKVHPEHDGGFKSRFAIRYSVQSLSSPQQFGLCQNKSQLIPIRCQTN